jgi:hypothetical protein
MSSKTLKHHFLFGGQIIFHFYKRQKMISNTKANPKNKPFATTSYSRIAGNAFDY